MFGIISYFNGVCVERTVHTASNCCCCWDLQYSWRTHIVYHKHSTKDWVNQ